jgi:hypothetical protein
VNSSKRPISIKIDKYHFAKIGNEANVSEGPKFPTPGPTLAIDDSEHPKASLVDNPQSIITIVDTMVIIKNIDINTYVFESVFSDTILRLTLTGRIAFGCITRLNS